ncbi:unnamed protein product [Parnassius apollo]|uniref:(apollo) hypothetical protein n=1 Tax=Parnassius apollo TaxID=110799 RepID=A0A8S3XG32_PARAO|nr:unnamed protein product [Parnassius apollo]
MQLKLDLEKGDTKKKIEALKKTIGIILAGEKIPGLLMIIIRFVLPLQDHTIKKLLLIFWEIVPKTSPDGKLLQEMILVCDAYRKDLQHPNEFIRGSTLRFLCKLKEPELLEPLMPAIRACLEHRHSYVRRNAVLAIFTIYRNFEFLIPDAPELVANFLETEQDMSCKRNAFLMLLHADQERALSYLSSRLDNVQSFGDILQLVIVELIYKVCHANPAERPRFIRTVYGLLNAGSAAVRYEAAGTLVTLSNAPAAIKAAAACYIDLIVKESDNNVKLIVVGRLSALRAEGGEAATRALSDLAMDVLRVLAASDLDVRRHTLQLALELVSSRHAEELVGVLRKEAARTNNAEHEDATAYRQLLVRAMHRAALKFPEVAGSVWPALLELVGEGNEAAAHDVMRFLRAALLAFPDLADPLYRKLLEAVVNIRVGKIARSALWLIAEFAETEERAQAALEMLTSVIPTPNSDEENKEEEAPAAQKQEVPARQLVTSDGTYASQSAFNLPASGGMGASASGGALRAALCTGDSFTAACGVSALAKLALRLPRAAAARALHRAAALLLHHAHHARATGWYPAGGAATDSRRRGGAGQAGVARCNAPPRCCCTTRTTRALQVGILQAERPQIHGGVSALAKLALLAATRRRAAAAPRAPRARYRSVSCRRSGHRFTAACRRWPSWRCLRALHRAAALLLHHAHHVRSTGRYPVSGAGTASRWRATCRRWPSWRYACLALPPLARCTYARFTGRYPAGGVGTTSRRRPAYRRWPSCLLTEVNSPRLTLHLVCLYTSEDHNITFTVTAPRASVCLKEPTLHSLTLHPVLSVRLEGQARFLTTITCIKSRAACRPQRTDVSLQHLPTLRLMRHIRLERPTHTLIIFSYYTKHL